MANSRKPFPIGLRTAKTVAAVILSMIIVDAFGTTSSKRIFAMLGAMAAMMPTFQDTIESCLTQIVGVLIGAAIGVLLRMFPLHPLVSTGIGMVLVITLYNAFHVRFSPSLPCFIVVMVCTTADVSPTQYAFGRIWDTAIGLGIGMLINTLVFPYDNSRQIRATMESLDREVIAFLEEMFDGDSILPDVEEMSRKIDAMAQQLTLFSRQRLLLRLRRQQHQLKNFRLCEVKARALVAQMEVLCLMGKPGMLSAENRTRLEECGAAIRDTRVLESPQERDIVTNYHVRQILALRLELLEALQK